MIESRIFVTSEGVATGCEFEFEEFEEGLFLLLPRTLTFFVLFDVEFVEVEV